MSLNSDWNLRSSHYETIQGTARAKVVLEQVTEIQGGDREVLRECRMTVEHVETRRQTFASAQNYEQRELKWVRDSALGTSSKLVLHRFKFSTADVAELAQTILALRPGLNFLCPLVWALNTL
jgi:hypothetical protein